MNLELLARLELSAASGLVHHEGALFTVADDGMELLRTDLTGGKPSLLPLADGLRVAAIPKDRKADFEALLVVGASLFAVGSGSSPARRLAIGVDREGKNRRTIDLRPLYSALDRRIHELNIEGAVISGDDVFLAQRGNGARGENALVRLDRALRAGSRGRDDHRNLSARGAAGVAGRARGRAALADRSLPGPAGRAALHGRGRRHH